MNRKGISPLIAAVLLIAFTVAIATIVMGWMSTTTRDTTQDISDKLGSATDCSNAAVSIQGLTENGGNYTIMVSNSGYYNFTRVDGIILFTDGTVCEFDNITLNTGSLGTLTQTGCKDISAESEISRVSIATDCGGIGDYITGSDTSYINVE